MADPSPYFVLEEYRSQLQERQIDITGCLLHYVKTGHLLGLVPNLLFDPGWYYRQIEGVHDFWSGLRHFVLTGDKEGCPPSPAFSSIRYRELNPDVSVAGVPPFFHYLVHGRAEQRSYAPLQANTAVPTALASDHPLDGQAIGQDEAL